MEANEELIEQIRCYGSFNGEGIVDGLQKLADAHFWGSPIDDEPEATMGGDMPLNVVKVLDDGWVFEDKWGQWGGGGGDSSIQATVPLSPAVAKLGVAGMSLSCMNLELHRGIWRPVANDYGNMIVANAYPP